jgi:hypothetical protein
LSLSLPGGLGDAIAKVYLGVGLAVPVLTGALSILFVQSGLMTNVEVYPWDNILSDLYLLTLLLTPESICIYLFRKKIIKSFMARMGYVVILVFVYANYVFLPASAYSFLPEAPAILLWALWPAVVALGLGFAAGKIESRGVLGERLTVGQSATPN